MFLIYLAWPGMRECVPRNKQGIWCCRFYTVLIDGSGFGDICWPLTAIERLNQDGQGPWQQFMNPLLPGLWKGKQKKRKVGMCYCLPPSFSTPMGNGLLNNIYLCYSIWIAEKAKTWSLLDLNQGRLFRNPGFEPALGIAIYMYI